LAPTGLISQSAIDAMWNNSDENVSTTWTNNGGGNFDSWANAFEQHTYKNSPFYENSWYSTGGRINAVEGRTASAIESLIFFRRCIYS
jgi:hypothetical protein